MASLENLKELYSETFSLYQNTPVDRKRFTEILE